MAHVTSPDTPRRPRADVVARRMGRTGVLVDLRSSRIFELNNTAARVWELLGSSQTPDGNRVATRRGSSPWTSARSSASCRACLASSSTKGCSSHEWRP